MKLMNNTTGEYQVLPEEMLSKRQVLFSSRYETTDFPTLLYTSSLKKGTSSIGGTTVSPFLLWYRCGIN